MMFPLAEKKGVPPRKHNCSPNLSGSTKSMEPAMTCEMLEGIKTKDTGNILEGADFGYMDIDSTTIAKIKTTVDQTITKKSDGNHTR
uniref:Mutator-like transposase domain-containing protein n=1 Tax=Magallana gigas TaxID=29159 RepID=K1PUU4_MAGGI